jgi:hypothetical protein
LEVDAVSMAQSPVWEGWVRNERRGGTKEDVTQLVFMFSHCRLNPRFL